MTVVASCGLRTCPFCARRRAQRLRRRLRNAWDHREKDRRMDLRFLTFTVRYDPTDPADVTAEALRERKKRALAAWSSIWRSYLKPRGRAAARAVEVGASGVVHIHVLYWGRRPEIDQLRGRWLLKIPDSPFVDVQPVKKPKKAIAELAKYLTKSASPAKADVFAGSKVGTFIDPRLAARVELAFAGDRLIECYGDWRNIDVDADDDHDAAEERDLSNATCACCGRVGQWGLVRFDTADWLGVHGHQWKPRFGGAGPPPTDSMAVSHLAATA
jgi:hypothetical protein